MSQLYGAAVQEGISSLEIMFTGSNAKTRAAYNAAYGAEAQRIAARARIRSAQSNLAAIQQDKILTNREIQVRNTQAQAMVKLSAAVAGVTGNSVNDVSHMNEVNRQRALSNNERKAEQLSDQFLNQIQSAVTTSLGIQDQKISYSGELMEAFGKNLSTEDVQGMGQSLGFFGG